MQAKFLLAAVLMIIQMLSIPEDSAAKEDKPGGEITAVYFHTSVCAACDEAEKALADFEKVIRAENLKLNINIRAFNDAEPSGYELLYQYFDRYKVPENARFTPVLFIGDRYYVGEKVINEGLRSELSGIKSGVIPRTPELYLKEQEPVRAEENFSAFTGAGVLITGLINGFNPCSLSMLLFLLSLVLVKNVKIWKIGAAFAAGKYLMYLLLGTVLFQFLSKVGTDLYRAVSKTILALFMFLIIILYVRDFFMAKSEKYDRIKMRLPAFLRKYNHLFIQRLTAVNNMKALIGVSFILGLVISVGEFLCTGQIFLATILYVLQSNSILSLRAFTYLLIYTTAFMVPLLAVVFFLDRTREIFEVSEQIRARLPLIKLATAVVFLGLGVFIIFGT